MKSKTEVTCKMQTVATFDVDDPEKVAHLVVAFLGADKGVPAVAVRTETGWAVEITGTRIEFNLAKRSEDQATARKKLPGGTKKWFFFQKKSENPRGASSDPRAHKPKSS